MTENRQPSKNLRAFIEIIFQGREVQSNFELRIHKCLAFQRHVEISAVTTSSPAPLEVHLHAAYNFSQNNK